MIEENGISRSRGTERLLIALSLCLLPGVFACSGSDGSQGPQGPPGGGGPTSTVLSQGDSLPGIELAITDLSGGSGPGGKFEVGDKIKVHFTVKKTDGTAWDLSEFSTGRVLVSGPSFNYQRVIAEQSDVVAGSVKNGAGSYTYTFATGIPATYLAPLNDSASFGANEGELTGQALISGTYTVGMYVGWNYTLDGASKRDAGNAVTDFLFGSASTIDHREVVKQELCNQCHQDLQIHGGLRRDVALCVLCHNSGAEDGNNAAVAGGTPGVSVDFKVMIHKIHMGEHLPSVNGVATNPDGSRNYAATPKPYLIAGKNSAHDYSDVAFPAWPNALIPMPRDQGYSALTSGQKATEDLIREGPANCLVCHGDPDGAGPLTAPAQGDLYRAQPSQQACGACHDDVSWGDPYSSNGQTMGAQANNANCLLCHQSPGSSIDVAAAHTHPLKNTTFDPGLDLAVSSLVEAGTNDGDGTIDPGEKIAITFTIKDDSGADVAPVGLSSISLIVSGPTSNYNLLLNTSIPTAALTGAQPFTTNVPMLVNLEFLGDSTGALDSFVSAYTPHWNVANALTSVLVRTATSGGDAVLSAASAAPQNFVDVDDPSGFARDDYVVVDDGVGGLEEYAKIQYVDGNRLWFGSPASSSYPLGFLKPHAAGATVKEVTLATKVAGTDYALTAATGTIDELVEFGSGRAVLATYTTDFVMPSTYSMAINESPDLTDANGKWNGKSIVDGTYSLSLYGSAALNWVQFGETTAYRNTSIAHNTDFLVGSATTIEPYALISSGQNCNACHQDVAFHGGGRRGVDACIVCHASAGGEDRAQYVAANAPATVGVTVNFRTMLHKIHMGEELTNASTYTVVGFGSAAYPNNFTPQNYGEVVFPALPSGVENCTKCHGAANTAWHQPSDRNHPTEQVEPVLAWHAVCAACHDSDAAQAHIDIQTLNGVESCDVCHGSLKEWNVQKMHKTY